MSKIYVYDAKCDDFANFGLVGALEPTSCVFEEEANGMSEITLEHPLDALEKYKALEINNLIQVGVPVRTTPELSDDSDSFVTTVWVAKILPSAAAYRTLYKTRSGSGRIKVLPSGTRVTVVKKYDEGRWKVKCTYGTGWVHQDAIGEETATTIEDTPQAIESVEPAWTIKPQIFRIYEVRKDISSITVAARHITYDLLYQTTNFKAADAKTCKEALAGIFDNIYGFTYIDGNTPGVSTEFNAYTNLANTYAGIDWARINPINALLDPDTGLTHLFNASLVRDNWDLYLLNDPGMDRGVRVEYARNMTGIEYIESTDEIATRIIPIGETKDGKPLPYKPIFADGTEVHPAVNYIDSTRRVVVNGEEIPIMSAYPIPYTMVLECKNCKVGSGGITTNVQAYERMRQQVQALYAEGIDLPKIEMSVDFVDLGDTEEYKQFKGLERLFLWDYVHVIHKLHGIDVLAKIVSIRWDCLLDRMERMEIGNTIKTLASSPGYTPPAGGSFSVSGDGYIAASGGTMTGALILSKDPEEELEAVTKQYVDSKLGSGGSGGSVIYSTEEVQTGNLWIDNKPIYRRVFTGTVKASTGATIATDIGFETVINLDGTLSYTIDSGTLMQRPLNYYNSATIYSRVNASGADGGKIQVYSTQAGDVFVIMEYTKTVDLPVDPNTYLVDSEGNSFMTADDESFIVEV